MTIYGVTNMKTIHLIECSDKVMWKVSVCILRRLLPNMQRSLRGVRGIDFNVFTRAYSYTKKYSKGRAGDWEMQVAEAMFRRTREGALSHSYLHGVIRHYDNICFRPTDGEALIEAITFFAANYLLKNEIPKFKYCNAIKRRKKVIQYINTFIKENVYA